MKDQRLIQARTRVAFANALRGFAALAVVISHYFGSFWVRRAAVTFLTNAPILPIELHPTPNLVRLLYAFPIFDLGVYGVALFFIISGFVIPFSLQKMTWIGFLINRLIRILPTYIFGFSITLLAIFISTKYFSKDWPITFKEIVIHYLPGIRDVLCSRIIDGIVWTLEIEMKFYFMCALLIVWFRKQSLKVFLAPVFLFAFGICLILWSKFHPSTARYARAFMMVSQFIIYMFIGVTLHYLYSGKIKVNIAYLGIGVLFAMFCIYWRARSPEDCYEAWNFGFALLTFIFAYSFPRFFRANIIFDFFADISYPLYVVHAVAGYVALRIMLENGFKVWTALLILISVCLIVSWLLHISIERPSQILGKRIAMKIAGSSKAYKAIFHK